MRRRQWIVAALVPTAVGLQAIYPFWGKRVSIHVFDKSTRAWKQVQTAKLTEHGGGGYMWTSGKFRPRVPTNVQMRADSGIVQT